MTSSALGANLPLKAMGPQVDSRDAVRYHLEEATRRAKIIRALLGIAKVRLRVRAGIAEVRLRVRVGVPRPPGASSSYPYPYPYPYP